MHLAMQAWQTAGNAERPYIVSEDVCEWEGFLYRIRHHGPQGWWQGAHPYIPMGVVMLVFVSE
jgi:hypothetical protein